MIAEELRGKVGPRVVIIHGLKVAHLKHSCHSNPFDSILGRKIKGKGYGH